MIMCCKFMLAFLLALLALCSIIICCLLGRMLVVVATSTCSEVIGHGVGCNPRPRLRHVLHRLLQCIVGWGTEATRYSVF